MIFKYYNSIEPYYFIYFDYIALVKYLKISLLNFNIKILYKLNNLIYIKFYFEKTIVYYLKIFFNIKNTFVYFKPNYYYFRKTRNNLSYLRKFKTYLSTAFLSTLTMSNINNLKHLTHNLYFYKNINLFNTYNFIYLINLYDIHFDNIFNSIYIILKYNNIYYIVFLYFFIYLLFFIILFFINKKFYKLFFFCDKLNEDIQYNWKLILKKNINNKFLKLFKNKTWYYFAMSNNILNKYLFNILSLGDYHNKLKKLFNNNLLIEITNKKFLLDFSTIFYKNFNFIKSISIPILKLKMEKKNYRILFYNFFNNNLLNFCFLYWCIIIPYFFFEYVLMRYHLKGHIRNKRKLIIFFKIFLDNFKFYIKLFKFIGDGIYRKAKARYPKNFYNSPLLRKKKRLKHGYFFKWDRFSFSIIRMLPLGTYYYWFFNINRWEYFFSYYKYFFNFVLKSNYFCILYIYILILIYLIKTKLKIFKFNFIKIKLNSILKILNIIK